MTDFELVFLGTSSAVPTEHRGLSSIAVVRSGEILLFDAGEGTQRRFAEAGLGFNKKMKIFITHMHGDHCVGLLGMLQTMSMLNRSNPLSVYGPPGLLSFVRGNIRMLKFGLTFQLEVNTVKADGVVVEEKDYLVRACRGEHHITDYAYVLDEKERPGVFHPERARRLGVPEGELWSNLQHGEPIKLNGEKVYPSEVLGPSRPGRKIAISGDTRPTLKLRRCIKGADVAVLDSTYFDDHADKAREHLHMTAREAAEMASAAGVNLLVLTHFSSRYEDVTPYVYQAVEVHPNVVAASDQMVLEVPYPDEGLPRVKSAK